MKKELVIALDAKGHKVVIIPVVNEGNTITHYNVYLATLIVRKDYRKKMHLYDIVHVKKESSFNFVL